MRLRNHIILTGPLVLLAAGCRTTAAIIEPAGDSPANIWAEAAPLPEAGRNLNGSQPGRAEPAGDETPRRSHAHGSNGWVLKPLRAKGVKEHGH